MKKNLRLIAITTLLFTYGEAYALYESGDILAVGVDAGTKSWGRCGNGKNSLSPDGFSVSPIDPNYCNANGGWVNAFPDPAYGGQWVTSSPLASEATSVGWLALASATHATAIGAESFANANHAIAIGSYTSSMNVGSIAIGSMSRALSAKGVAIGFNSLSNAGVETYNYAAQMNGAISNSVADFSVGNLETGELRRITNVADGYANQDAVNVKQLNSGVNNAIFAADTYTNAVGSSVLSQANGYSDAVGNNSVNAANAYTNAVGSSVLGQANSYSDAVGNNAVNAANAYTDNKTGLLGTSVAANFGGGSAYDPVTGKISSPAITVAGTDYTNTTAAIQALDSHAVKYDNNVSGTPNYSSATLSGATGTTIHNLTAGVAGTDAVNVNQLNTLSTKNNGSLASVASSLGGGAIYNSATGTISQPTYTIGTAGYNNVGSALTAANNQISALGNSTASSIGGGSIFDPVTGKISAPAITVAGTDYTNTTAAIQALDSHAVKYDNNADGTPNYSKVTLSGATGTTIQNLSAGVAGTDAVNVDQLNTGITSSIGLISNKYDNSLASVASSLGGGASYDSTTGTISQPTYTIGTAGYNNVGAAFNAANNQNSALGNSTASNFGGGSTYDSATGKISSPTIGVAGTNYNNATDAVQALDSHAVKYDNNADGTPNYSSTTLSGTTGTTIHNLTAGVAGKDAVNVEQFNNGVTKAVDTANTYTNGKVLTLSESINGKYDGSLASVASNFGGGSTYDSATGKISSPTIGVAGTNYNNATDAVQALDSHAVKYDNNADGTPNYSSTTLSGTTGTTIHNLTAGVAGKDAVNVEQLNTASDKSNGSLASVASSLGGGATYDSTTGKISAPTYTIGTAGYNDIGSGFNAANNQTAALGNSTASSIGGGSTFDPVTGKISSPTIGVAGTNYNNATDAVQALDSHAVKYDNNADGTPNYSGITLGSAGTTTIIHNITAGVVGTDAANVQQVQDAVKTANNYTDGQISNTQSQIASLGNKNQAQFNTLSAQIKSTGAIAAAMSGLVPNYHSAKKLQAQAAVGYGSGAAGIGAGATYQISNDVLLVGKMGFSTNSGVGMANRIGAAVGVSLGL